MSVHLSPRGISLDLLERAHGSECATQQMLRNHFYRVAREMDAILIRFRASEEIKARIEQAMSEILDERKAA